MRKIIQIASAPSRSTAILYALCNDGSLWVHEYGEWRQFDDIPQPEPERKKTVTIRKPVFPGKGEEERL